MLNKLIIVVFDIHLGGGGERVAVNIGNHYMFQGWEVEYISFSNMKNKPIFNLPLNTKIHYLNTSSNKLIQKIQAYNRLNCYLNNFHDCYVLAIGAYTSSILSLCKKKGKVYIGSEHSYFYNQSLIWNIVRKLCYPHLSAITVLTNTDYKILKQINKNTFVIPNALGQLPPKRIFSRGKVFLAVGRLDAGKQFDQLIEVFNKFTKRNSQWKLIIVGEGSEYYKLAEMIHKYELEERVMLKPFTNCIEDEYSYSSILVSTSRAEGLPMTMIEAQSYGLPIIAYDCKTGPSDIIIDGRNGFLVPLNNENIMLEKMFELSENEDLCKQMGEYALEDSLRFSSLNVYSKWNALFDVYN